MKRFLAFLCVLAMALGVVNPAVFAAEISDVQAVIDAGTEEIIVLEADAFNITIDNDTTIDLNGHSIDGVTVLAGTLYCMDSQTADYTVADGVYGHVTNVTGSVKAAPGYLQVGDSFHAVNLDIYAMTLRAADVGVYYKSKFAADEVVAAQVESFGVALSVVTAPSAENLETYCGYSQFTGFEAGEGANSASNSTLLKNIMKAANDDEKNAKNAAMPVYGRAYIKTSEGYVFGETVKRSLQEQVEAIDQVWNKLTDAQKTPVLSMLEDYTAVMENWEIPNIQGIQVPGTEGEIEIPVEVTAENGIVTEAVTVEQDEISITVPAGTKLAEGVESLTLTVTPKETSEAGLTLEKSEVLMPMDVHVDGLAADNAQPLTIYLGKVMAENLNMGNYTVYHVENGKANEMVLIPVGAEFTAHNQYKYTLDGELTLYMASFSEVAVVSDVNNAWEGNRDYTWYNTTDEVLYIRNADQLAGFGAIVGGMAKDKDGNYLITYTDSDGDVHHNDTFSGKTVVLWSDINLGDDEENNVEGKIFYPIGYWNSDGVYEKTGTAISSGFYAFAGTFDGNGNAISNFYQNTWEMKGDHDWYDANLQYYRDGMGLFGKVYGGTVRNLIVDNFSCDSEIGTSGVIAAYADSINGQPAVFENITITNCNPRVYNIGNGGIVGCAGWYSRNDTELKSEDYANAVTFRNITVDQSNKISALWGSWGVSCAGILGQYYPNSACGIKLENCHVAAIIDVNNDVCSNYQYYWYRYAGMFIGTIRANTKDANGYEIADTTGVTATGCTYTMGNWNEYWYCEIVANSIASYTHDHQFSRLDNITDISEIQSGDTWLKEGHFALLSADRKSVECYHIFKNSNGELYRHFHDVADESNPNIYEDFDLDGNGKLDDLKEDRQRYFIPFNQLLTGLDMGIKAHTEFEGIRFVENGTIKSEPKFESIVDKDATYKAGQTIYLDELVKAIVDESKISKATLYAAVSPAVDDDNATVSATYALDAGNWQNCSITFGEECTGAIKIVITDYFYCTPTVIILNPEVAAPKFEAINGIEKDAYTRITLGDLFGVKDGATINEKVTATITAPNGNETTVTGTSADWTTKTIDLTQNGQWKVVIVENDASCEATEVTFTVNPADKFVKKFDKDFLYRIGNKNTVDIGYIFGEETTAVAVSSVNVTVENVEGNATGSFANNATWTSGKLTFTGTGVVKVTISADGANAVSLYLEVVNAKNITGAEDAKGSKENWAAVVLVQNINTETYRNYQYAQIFGNGFTYSLHKAPTTYRSQQGHGILILRNAILDNVVILGDVYSEYGAYTNNEYYNAAIDVPTDGGNVIIRNSYIANCAAPIKTRGGNITIVDTTLYGGTVANILISSGVVTLENVTTVNYNDERGVAGLGIVIHPDATDGAELILEGELKQYNFLNEKNKPDGLEPGQIHTTMFSSSSCEKYLFGTSPNRYANTGIISMTGTFTKDDLTDRANTGYEYTAVSLGDKNGFVYTQLNTDGSVDNNYDYNSDPHVATTYGAVEPDYNFDFEAKNYQPKQDGVNDYCYEDNGVVNISMDEGDIFNWDTSILTVGKAGEALAYTVTMDNADYTGKSIAFNTAGEYVVTYTYTDSNNFKLENGQIVTYNEKYEKTVHIYVAVVEAATKHAEFTFGSSNTSSKTLTIGNDTWVMPDVSATSSTIGSTTVSGQTIYYPIVEIIMSDGEKNHTSGWYAYFPVFANAVTITDYKDGGLGDPDIFGSSQQSMPAGLTLDGEASTIFKYQSGSAAGSSPVVKNNILVYSSAIIEAKRNEYNTVVKYIYKDNANTTYFYYIGYHAPAQTYTNCVTPDTLITLDDGTQVKVEDLTGTEELLVWNLETGSYDSAPIVFVDSDAETEYEIVHLYFADGTDVEVIYEHGFFDADLGKYVYLDASNAADYIGHSFIKQGDIANGTWETVELTEVVIEKKVTTAYSPVTFSHLCYYVDGMLSMPGGIDGLFNIFEVDTDTMAYNAEKKAQDIETYGLYTYEDFADLIPEEAFYAFNGAYLKVAIAKGLLTWEDIAYMAERYVPLM